MFRIVLIIVVMIAIVYTVPVFAQNASNIGGTATNLAANVVDAAVEALASGDGGPKWEKLDKRLNTLYRNKTKGGDEAIVILMSFYLGEHNGEELQENLVGRGPRMIPLLERYLHEEPLPLLNRYAERVRLERATTVSFLRDDLEVLRVRAGSRRVAGMSVETAPLRQQAGECAVKLIQQPKFNFNDNLVQPGESYSVPVLRADIDENGNLGNVQMLSASGIRRLDALLLSDLSEWKYAQRRQCGVVPANIVIEIDWSPPSPKR